MQVANSELPSAKARLISVSGSGALRARLGLGARPLPTSLSCRILSSLARLAGRLVGGSVHQCLQLRPSRYIYKYIDHNTKRHCNLQKGYTTLLCLGSVFGKFLSLKERISNKAFRLHLVSTYLNLFFRLKDLPRSIARLVCNWHC